MAIQKSPLTGKPTSIPGMAPRPVVAPKPMPGPAQRPTGMPGLAPRPAPGPVNKVNPLAGQRTAKTPIFDPFPMPVPYPQPGGPGGKGGFFGLPYTPGGNDQPVPVTPPFNWFDNFYDRGPGSTDPSLPPGAVYMPLEQGPGLGNPPSIPVTGTALPQPFNANPNPVSNMGAGQMPQQSNQYANAQPQQQFNGQLDLSSMFGQPQPQQAVPANMFGAQTNTPGGKSAGPTGTNAGYGGGKSGRG